MKPTASPIRLGALFSDIGLTAVVERTQRQAVAMAVDEINAAGGLLGREVEIEAGDSRSDPARARAEAERLLASGVETIFGCYMSSTRRAVLPVVEQRRGLLFYPTLYEGFEYSAHCIYSGAAPNQNSVWLADHMLRRYGTRFYFVGSNYVFPYESNRIMRDYVQSCGGAVVEERYLPLHPSDDDVARVIAEIRRHAPVMVFSTTVGDATTSFYRAYERAGFDRSVMPIGSLTTGEPELAAMGADAAEGHLTAAPYFSTIDTPRNARFVEAFRARCGADAPISANTEAAYFQVHLYAQAVERTGTTDVAAVRANLPGCAYDAPQGPVRIDGRTHHTELWPRVGVATARREFAVVEAAAAAVPPDPYMVDPEPRAWGARALAI
jgi:branched-chain amino acid transport system substrate-binding protein